MPSRLPFLVSGRTRFASPRGARPAASCLGARLGLPGRSTAEDLIAFVAGRAGSGVVAETLTFKCLVLGWAVRGASTGTPGRGFSSSGVAESVGRGSCLRAKMQEGSSERRSGLASFPVSIILF